MQKIDEKLKQQMIKNSREQQKTKLEVEMEVLWKQLIKIPKWESKQMKEERRNNIHPMKRTTKDKEVEKKQSKVWDPGKLQARTVKQQLD